MGTKSIPVLFVTANVGSIFEDPTEMLKYWTQEFLSTVAKLDPKFIALHCQEVGGKNYEKSMKYVEDFVKLLMTSEELRLFDRVRVFIDEDYSSAENFTALGNIYFVHESIEDVFIWDFKDLEFVNVEGAEINTGNIENVVTKEKAKFPQDFFPECKWSRKGFLRTRWSVCGTVFDLINIHLFHDASNFIAMEAFPSVYCKNRRRALEHTLQRFHSDKHGTAPFFVFGDFNFRTDTDGVVKKLTRGLTTTKVPHHKSNDYAKLQFHNEDSQLILTVGKKEFNHSEHQDVFLTSDGSWLKSYDRELEAFENQLFEFPVHFPPSYPFEEKVACGATYMQTRCPAWCDRVLLSHTAKTLVNEEAPVGYNLIGRETCMGDHKPVYLRLNLRSGSGIVSCCEHSNACTSPPVALCTCCQRYASIEINIIDMSCGGDYLQRNSFIDVVDSTLLHDAYTKHQLMHDPYTPESIESHSPLPSDDAQQKDDAIPPAGFGPDRKLSVSPRILKSRLENILRTELPESNRTECNIELTKPKRYNESIIECNDELTKSKRFNDSIIELQTKAKRFESLTKLDRNRSQSQHINYRPEVYQRARCQSESAKKNTRARLISTTSVHSAHRLQSHHSSSDEDWFDFEEKDAELNDSKINLTDDIFTDTVDKKQDLIELTEDNNRNIEKKNKINKQACCCCIF